MTSLLKRAKARNRNIRERLGKHWRPRKNAAYAVFRLDDVYRDGVWWPAYSARPKRRVFKSSDGKEAWLPATCERWQDVAERLRKSKQQFLAIMRFFGRA